MVLAMSHPVKSAVAVADGFEISRSRLVECIGTHPLLKVCGEASSLDDTLDLCARVQPPLLAIAATLGDLCSFLHELRHKSAGTRAVVRLLWFDHSSVQRLFKAGAYGLVSFNEYPPTVVTALVRALEGRRYAGPYVARTLRRRLAQKQSSVGENTPVTLTDRERLILKLVIDGLSAREIAARCSLSLKTAETYRQRIQHKLRGGE